MTIADCAVHWLSTIGHPVLQKGVVAVTVIMDTTVPTASSLTSTTTLRRHDSSRAHSSGPDYSFITLTPCPIAHEASITLYRVLLWFCSTRREDTRCRHRV